MTYDEFMQWESAMNVVCSECDEPYEMEDKEDGANSVCDSCPVSKTFVKLWALTQKDRLRERFGGSDV